MKKKNRICGIYEIKNAQTGRVYIGSSVNVESRLNNHATLLKSGKHSNKGLQDDYDCGARFEYRVLKRLAIDNKSELMEEEAREIAKRRERGESLYNVGHLHINHFISKEMLEKKFADLYSLMNYGVTFECLANCVPSKIEMYYHIAEAKTEKEIEEIKAKYADIIDYQNKKSNYRSLYGLDYDAVMQLPREERKKRIKDAQKKRGWKKAQ